jgi:bile acid:Na+ symporter, BASS family
MLQRYLVLWLIASSGAAFFWPAVAGSAFDPWVVTGADWAVASRVPLGAVVALTMFAIGALLPRDEVARVLQRWPLVIGGTTTQYIAMPMLAFLLANLIPLPKELFIGVVLVGCVPGAMASNVLTLAARGNVSYSVSLTTAATLLSPLVVPLAMALTLSATAAINPLDVSLKLLREVVGPVVAGHLLSRRWETFARAMGVIGSPIANLAILWIIATVVALNRDRLADISASMLAVLVFLNLGGYTAGHLGARLLRIDEGMRRALILEVGMQNAGVGTALAVSLFPEHPAVAIPTAAYTFGCMLSGSVLAWWFSRNPPAGDPSAAETDPLIPE